jgi:Mg2+/Co2+ transporter CorB
MSLSLLFPICAMFLLIMISSFLACSETAIISASAAKLQKLKKEGNKKAKIALKLAEEKEIGAILLGNNFVTSAAITLTTKVSIDIFGDTIEVLTAVTFAITILLLLYAEIMPKTYAVRNAEKVALAVSPLFSWITYMLYPVMLIIEWIVDKTFLIFGTKSNSEMAMKIDALETIRGAIELHHQEGEVIHEDKYMLGGIIDLNEVRVDEIMIHRNEIQSLNLNEPINKLLDKIVKSKHSRLPVWEDKPDNIIGILYLKDVLKLLKEKVTTKIVRTDLVEIARKPWFIPSTTTLKHQLREFISKHLHFACVVDEYGELQGIITLEDILEEVVGQIDDEYDSSSETKIRQNKDGSVTASGETSIRDLNRTVHWSLSDKEAATVGGLLLHLAQGIPTMGKVYKFKKYKLTLIKNQGAKILRVKIRKQEEVEEK